ncbi:hypothetical protein BH09ACT6_BH09ACT6_17360 [soil metagenome]
MPSDAMPPTDSDILDESEHLEQLRQQERALQFDSFDFDEALAWLPSEQ